MCNEQHRMLYEMVCICISDRVVFPTKTKSKWFFSIQKKKPNRNTHNHTYIQRSWCSYCFTVFGSGYVYLYLCILYILCRWQAGNEKKTSRRRLSFFGIFKETIESHYKNTYLKYIPHPKISWRIYIFPLYMYALSMCFWYYIFKEKVPARWPC